jgi:putative two-component system response regulator
VAIGAALRVDPTGWHGVRVGALTKALALEHGCPPLEAMEIGLAAELHDIGLASVPQGVLAKSGAPNEVERGLIRRHIDAGTEILRDDLAPRMLVAREIARYHHARWDGIGYPERVGGQFIPLAARMCAIADAYDDLVSGQPGTEAHSMNDALQVLSRAAGSEFDPALLVEFETMVRKQTREQDIDAEAAPGLEGFRQLIASLEEDRGFA